MPLISNPTTQILEHVLRFRDQRHDLIAANLANASTPGYRAFDLALNQALGDGPLSLQGSDPRHFATQSAASGRTVASNAPARLDGNNVSLEDELLKLLENRTLYQTAFELRDRLASLTGLARDVR